MGMYENSDEDDNGSYFNEDDNEGDLAMTDFMEELHELSAALSPSCKVILRGVAFMRAEVYQVTTENSARGRGLAGKAMKLVTDLANKHHIWLVLEAAANIDGNGMTDAQLREWYGRLGFVCTTTGMCRFPCPCPSHDSDDLSGTTP